MRSEDSLIYKGIRRDESTRVGTQAHPVLPDMTCSVTGIKFFNAVPSSPPQSLPGVQPYARKVVVYVPQQLPLEVAAPFIVVNDGAPVAPVVTPMLDNLIAAGRLPALVAIFLDSGGSDAQGSQRGLEYDTASGLFASFVDAEVLPRVVSETGVVLTSDPSGRAAMGFSSGGAAAFSMAWHRPDLFRRVLTYSGTYVNQQWPFDASTPQGCWGYHSGQDLIRTSPKKPIRVWHAVSEYDLGASMSADSLHSWPMANERMASALQAMGYDFRYVYAKGAGHCDPRVQVHTLPSALEWLWSDYRLRAEL